MWDTRSVFPKWRKKLPYTVYLTDPSFLAFSTGCLRACSVFWLKKASLILLVRTRLSASSFALIILYTPLLRITLRLSKALMKVISFLVTKSSNVSPIGLRETKFCLFLLTGSTATCTVSLPISAFPSMKTMKTGFSTLRIGTVKTLVTGSWLIYITTYNTTFLPAGTYFQ